jgi:hypothetical protein
MEASFDKQESMASQAELEKRLGEHAPSGRLASAPSAQLDADLAAILASVGSRSAPEGSDEAATSRSTAFILVPGEELPASALGKESAASAAGGGDAARLGGDRGDQAASSRSTALILVPEKGLPALSVEKESALSPPRNWVFLGAATLIVISSLVGGAGYLASRIESAALQAPAALPKSDPPPETTGQAPAAEQTADAEPATPAAAKQAASAAVSGGETPPAPAPDALPAGAEASARQPAQADAINPPAAVAQPPAAAVAPPPPAAGATQPPAENALSALEPPAGAAAEAPVATPALPANPTKPTADKWDEKSGKPEPQPNRHAKVGKHRPARAAHNGLTKLQHAVASFLGAVRGLLIPH